MGRLRILERGESRLLTVRAAAARLGISTATLYALCARGEIPHIRVPNAIRITPVDLSAYIARNRKA